MVAARALSWQAPDQTRERQRQSLRGGGWWRTGLLSPPPTLGLLFLPTQDEGSRHPTSGHPENSFLAVMGCIVSSH